MKFIKIATISVLVLSLALTSLGCNESGNGLSAYEIAVNNGFRGSEAQWLESLKGADGMNGEKGEDGKTGDKGGRGDRGEAGANGTDGVSVVNTYVNDDLHLIVVLSNGETIDAGYVGTDRDVGSGKPEFASSYECIRPGELFIVDCETKGLAWKSSDTGVARVTADGLILGIAEGECTVTATSYTGESTDCVIRVVDLSYKHNASGGVTVTSYNGIGKELVIPERLGGKPVTEIADYAFMMHETIESVTIPDTLTRIGSGAFSNCEKLASVTLGRSVEYIGAAALSETAIKSIELPESLTDLGSSVFYNTPLESIKLPSKVKTVRAFCFSECRKLTRVDLGSVERIDNYAFDTCTALTEITLPATLLSIGDEAFGSCSSLATVIFLNPNTAYSDTAFNGTLFVPEQSGPSGVDGEGFTIVDLTMYAVEATNVRSRPSFDEDPTYWLKKEEAVRVIGIRDDGWAKIIIGETTLYVRYLQLSDKKADQLYQDAKDFIAKSDSLTVGISFSPTESNYGVDQNTIKTIGNSLQSESPAIKYVISEATVVIVDGMAYVVSSDGEKTKSTADASVFKSAFFSSDSYITHVFADFTEYTLDVEYSGKTLTLSGLPKEIFVYDAGSHMGVPNTQEFSDSITEYSYTLTFHFNSEGKLVKIVEEFSYTIGKTTMMSYMAVTFSETAENITVPEDADLYLPEESA